MYLKATLNPAETWLLFICLGYLVYGFVSKK